MRIQRIVLAGLAVGAVALALAGCTDTARGEGYGQGGSQGYRVARYAQNLENQGQAARGIGRGQQAQSADDVPRGVLRSSGDAGRGGVRGAAEPASERTGRDVADVGTLRTLSGTLAIEDAEWYLDSAEGRYLLHLGNTAYVERTGLVLEVGETAVVKGIVDADEVSVVSLEIGGKTFALRSEDGRPLWAGGGRGAGRDAVRGSGQGSGRGGGLGA
jgi:hypothetical protein